MQYLRSFKFVSDEMRKYKYILDIYWKLMTIKLSYLFKINTEFKLDSKLCVDTYLDKYKSDESCFCINALLTYSHTRHFKWI